MVACLPMNDTSFIAKLSNYELLPGDTNDQLKTLPTQADKALYFLDNVIKPALDTDDTSSFDNLLFVMEHSNNNVVEKLACTVKSEFDEVDDIGPGTYDVLIY